MSLLTPPSPFVPVSDPSQNDKARPTPRVAFLDPVQNTGSEAVGAASETHTPAYDLATVESITGMIPGTLIRTPEFDVPVENLRIGDLVMTEDHGAQPIRFVKKAVLPADREHAPIMIDDRALGNVGALVVAPDFRVVLKGWRSARVAGAKAVLTAAQHLVNDRDIKRLYQKEVTYYHLAFDRHEIIQANSMLTESWHPETTAVQTLPDEIRGELRGLYPDVADRPNTYGPLALPEVKPYEARLIRP